MPRSSRGSAPRPASRPAPAPARPAAPQQQARPMSTAAHPPANTSMGQQQAQAQGRQGGGSGLFGQMASTAAGVAVGSSIGHAIGGFFGGGSSQQPPAETSPYSQPTDSYAQPGQTDNSAVYGSSYGSNSVGGYGVNSSTSRNEATGPCANDIKTFTECMNMNNGDMNICSWYLEQLRACQMAAKQYQG